MSVFSPRRLLWRVILPVLILLLPAASATAKTGCEQTGYTGTATRYAAPIRFGNVTLASAHLQPPGTLLASTVVPPTDYGYSKANADTILWICDASVLPQLHFLVSTNGDSRYGGHNEIGQADGLSDVYGTWFKNVGLRQTVDGVPVSRYWRRVPLRDYDRVKTGKRDLIYIRLKHVPALHAELYRVSSPVPNKGASAACGGIEKDPASKGIVYACSMPNAYISLVGPGLRHDNAGEDSSTRFVSWKNDNGFSYRMYRGSTLFQHASCAVRNNTPHVMFPTVTRAHMQAGGEISAPFNVQVECEDAAVSGTGNGQVSIGIQVSPGAWRAAQQLGLVTSDGGVRALVTDVTRSWRKVWVSGCKRITVSRCCLPDKPTPCLSIRARRAGCLCCKMRKSWAYPTPPDTACISVISPPSCTTCRGMR